MKNRKKYIIVSIFICVSIYSILCVSNLVNKANFIQTNTNKILKDNFVVIDAGHGDFDGGAENKELEIIEKDLNLQIAKKINNLLLINGFDTIMIRNDDTSTCDEGLKTIRQKKNSDILNRFSIMTKSKNNICVSIHMNKYEDKNISGAQVFFAPNNCKSDYLAECIQKSFKKYLQDNNNRKIKKADKSIYVLFRNKVNPSVMVECGFISNDNEGKLLKTDKYQKKVSLVILKGITEFNNGKESQNAT